MIITREEIVKMNETELNNKIEELKIELLKAKISNLKGGKSKLKEIRKTIARLLTQKNVKPKIKEKTLKTEKIKKEVKK